jgi:hypothetical protein
MVTAADDPASADYGPDGVSPPGRRSFLRGALGAGVTGAGYAYRSSQAQPPGQVLAAQMLEGRLPAVPFHGRHQAGILPKPSRQTIVLSFNVTVDGREN